MVKMDSNSSSIIAVRNVDLNKLVALSIEAGIDVNVMEPDNMYSFSALVDDLKSEWDNSSEWDSSSC